LKLCDSYRMYIQNRPSDDNINSTTSLFCCTKLFNFLCVSGGGEMIIVTIAECLDMGIFETHGFWTVTTLLTEKVVSGYLTWVSIEPCYFSIFRTSRPSVQFTQPPVQWFVLLFPQQWIGQGKKTGSSPPCKAEIRNAWSSTSTVPDAFLVCKGTTWQLVKYVTCMTALYSHTCVRTFTNSSKYIDIVYGLYIQNVFCVLRNRLSRTS